MPKQIIATNEAPLAVGPYAQATKVGDWVFLSGQIPLDPASGQIVDGGIVPQTRRVLDNLGAHKASCLEQVAEERGAQVLWLPPYSPDYSPIENCWSKIKTYLRAAKARTSERLDEAIKKAFETITESDARDIAAYLYTLR